MNTTSEISARRAATLAAGQVLHGVPEGSDNTAAVSLRSNVTWMVFGNIVYAACQWGLLVVLARLGSPELVGRFGLALALTAPIVMFLNMELRSIQATDAGREFEFADYFGARLVATITALLAIFVLAFGSGLYGRATSWVILCVGFAKALESLSDITHGLFMQHERLKFVSRSILLRGTVGLLAFGAALSATGDLVWSVLAMGVAWGLTFVCHDLLCVRALLGAPACLEQEQGPYVYCVVQPRWRKDRIRALVSIAWPLGLVTLLNSLNANIPRYFVERSLGEDALGVFVSLAYVQVVGTTVIRALASSTCHRLSVLRLNGDRRGFQRVHLRNVLSGLALGVLGVLGSVALGRFALGVLYGPEYAQQVWLLFWLMVGAGFLYVAMMASQTLVAVRRLSHQVPLLLAVMLVTLTACSVLVPRFGLLGTAYAVMAGNTAWATGCLALVGRVSRRREWSSLVKG